VLGVDKMAVVEDVVVDYYERIWSRFVLWWEAEKTLGLHYALYEKGIKTFEQGVFNMSDYVGRLLCLNKKNEMNILDAGCGVGGTSIYLAKKYPNLRFTGITITPGQLVLANKFVTERKLNNADFMLQNYMETDFSDEYFHNIFALESASYARNKKNFIKEMYRILTPGGRLAIIDAFLTSTPHNYFMKVLHDLTCIGRGVPIDADMNLQEFKEYLKEEGFIDIQVKDLSMNVARSQFRSFIIGIPFFLSSIIKFIVNRGKIDLTNNPDFSLGASVLCALYGVFGSAKYCSITAVKN